MRWVVWCLVGVAVACGKSRADADDPHTDGQGGASTGGSAGHAPMAGGAGREPGGGGSTGQGGATTGGTGSAGTPLGTAGSERASGGASGTAGASSTAGGSGPSDSAGVGTGGARGGEPASGGAVGSAGTSSAGAAGAPEEECGEYLACGCGCCGGTTPNHACYYPDRGDTLAQIIADDQAQAMDPSCAAAGCALGTEYACCVQPAEVEAATYRVDASSSNTDRISLFRADADDHCTVLTMSTSVEPPRFPLEVPEGWRVDVGSSGFYCAEAYNFPTQRIAIGAEGFVTFSTPDRCALDFDFTLYFSLGTEVQATRFVGEGVPVPYIGVGCDGAK